MSHLLKADRPLTALLPTGISDTSKGKPDYFQSVSSLLPVHSRSSCSYRSPPLEAAAGQPPATALQHPSLPLSLEPVSTKKSFSSGASDTKPLGDGNTERQPQTLGRQQDAAKGGGLTSQTGPSSPLMPQSSIAWLAWGPFRLRFLPSVYRTYNLKLAILGGCAGHTNARKLQHLVT